MKFVNYFLFQIIFILILSSCSSKSNLVYLNDSDSNNLNKINYSLLSQNIEPGDILKIEIQTIIPEAAKPYINISDNSSLNNIDLIRLNGYVVDKDYNINFPVLGNISVENQNVEQISKKIVELLVNGGHLSNPHVKVRRINSKFTILGEVKNPGTFSFYEKNINIFQALGYAGDLSIDGKRSNITLIRETNGLRKIYKISLLKSDIINKPYYNIYNNDVIIIKPNFSKVKSAGFIGSPSSIASISSLLLSITLLIINR
tara:strand:+ start:2947 stop:3723 length:777 start_codon:yes stop_codon:yes gene_type:complete